MGSIKKWKERWTLLSPSTNATLLQQTDLSKISKEVEGKKIRDETRNNQTIQQYNYQ